MEEYIGHLAALATATCWSMTSISFTNAGRLVGSAVVNRARLAMALVLIMLLNFVTEGEFLPIHADAARWGWLALSGAIGFVLGDALLFQGFVMIGARLSMLLMALAPVFSVFLSWIFLEERLATQELVGIALAVAGVVWVVTDRGGDNALIRQTNGTRYFVYGVLFALGGAIGQAVGLIASRKGLEGDFSPISGNAIRLLTATSLIWIMTIFQQQIQLTFRRLRDQPIALRWISLGAVFGPFIGVSLSLLAVQKAPVGIASTLMGLTPVILLPLSYFLFKEKIGLRAALGTVLAVAGTALIFLNVE